MSVTHLNSSCAKNIITHAEIQELDTFLQSLLHELDEKVSVLQSQSLSPPRSNHSSSQDIDSNTSCSVIKYSTVQDSDNPDIENVVAYEQVNGQVNDHVSNSENHNLTLKSSLLDDISSISSSLTLFSPVEPDLTSVKSFTSCDTAKSIDTISSIDTIERPPLSCTVNVSKSSPIIDNILVNPFSKLDNMPFQLFDVSKLEDTTTDYLKLGSRSVAYYGDYPYTYSGISHSARPYSDNKYLLHILSYVQIVLPDIKFNSAMIHRYPNGNSIIPRHSDDEECIHSESNIVTISLGETRSMEFQNKQTGLIKHVDMLHGDVLIMSKESQKYYTHAIPADASNNIRFSVTLRQINPLSQGTTATNVASSNVNDSQSTVTEFLYNMSCMPAANNNPTYPYIDPQPVQPFLESNDGYQDEVYHYSQPEQTQGPPLVIPRITKPSPKPNHSNQFPQRKQNPITHTLDRQRSQFNWHREGWQPQAPVLRAGNQRNQQQSVFPPEEMHPSRSNQSQGVTNHRTTNHRTTQFKRQEDVVFISSSMFADLDAHKLSSANIKSHVFFYRGADAYRMMTKLKDDASVQELAKRNTVSKVFLLTGTNNIDPICYQKQSINDGCASITKTVEYVKGLFSSAIVNVVNILPRVMENRRHVITQLNCHIKSLCETSPGNRLRFIDTYDIKIFTFPNGSRKSELFKYTFRNDMDNVHLNNYGVVKFGRHLKYLAHL